MKVSYGFELISYNKRNALGFAYLQINENRSTCLLPQPTSNNLLKLTKSFKTLHL
jgi:hypothetical protein